MAYWGSAVSILLVYFCLVVYLVMLRYFFLFYVVCLTLVVKDGAASQVPTLRQGLVCGPAVVI